MKTIHRAILELCLDDFRSVRPLRYRIPQSTVYRGVLHLTHVGWLQKEGTLYKTTEAGRWQLSEGQERRWDGVALHYPPLRLIPTVVHRALAELILAAIVMRRHGTRPDRHPFFLCAGGTLKWKSSLALFLCAALDLDPALFLVDCGCESGKSLSIRRSGSGTLVFKRELLDAVFILVMPFENESVRVQPVPLLILNPRDKPTVEGRLGLSAPQIRRAVVANLDVVPMPDLAVTGEEALAAARAHAPLILPAPAIDCRIYHRQIVDLTRAILLPEAEERIDVHIVETLCSGMTSFIPEANDAIAHVGKALGTIAETMGWTRVGWFDAVLHFSTEPKKLTAQPTEEPPSPITTMSGRRPPMMAGPESTPPSVLSLQVRHTIREPGLPSLAISDALKGKLCWLAEETGRPIEEVLPLLITFFRRWHEDPTTLMQWKTILSLARELDLAHMEMTTLLEYLETQKMLAQSHCTFDDIPEACRLIDALSVLPTPWDWPAARAALRNIALFLRAGITPDQIQVVLAQYCELEDLGFDGSTAIAVGKALARAGAVGTRRAAALKQMASLAVTTVQVQSLEAAQVTLAADVTRLDAHRDQLERSVAEMTKRVEALHRQEAEARQRLTQLEGEWTNKSEDLKALRALRTFLLRKDAAIDAFFADMDRVRQYRTQGRAPNHYAVLYLDEVRQQLLGFLQRIAEEGQQC
jgi:outer membrane murein-binding lipoprotein Lpp